MLGIVILLVKFFEEVFGFFFCLGEYYYYVCEYLWREVFNGDVVFDLSWWVFY